MARRKSMRRRHWLLYIFATLALAVTLGALAYWWDMRSWAPEAAIYPDQGVLVSDREGLVSFETIRAIGGKFAYLEASRGTTSRDSRFGRNFSAAKRAGLKVGALHVFNLCSSADAQSANFVTMVPRDAELLPPAIALIGTADNCPEKVSDAAVESELMTFINQVEMHAGQRAILKLSQDFQARYQIAGSIERDLWLMRDRFDPTYGGRPWLLWSANAARVTEASNQPLEWVVVQK